MSGNQSPFRAVEIYAAGILFQSLLVYILEPMILNQIYNNPRTV